MKDRIRADIETATPQTLFGEWQEDEYWLDIRRVTDGEHIEIYYLSCSPCETAVFF
jgi:hypothetical protein